MSGVVYCEHGVRCSAIVQTTPDPHALCDCCSTNDPTHGRRCATCSEDQPSLFGGVPTERPVITREQIRSAATTQPQRVLAALTTLHEGG